MVEWFDVAGLHGCAFAPSQLALHVQLAGAGRARLVTAGEVLEREAADAVLDGPMFGAGGALHYRYLDAARGLDVPSARPGEGQTISVVGGVAYALQRDQVAPGASVAVQGYPPLVWEGANVASASLNTHREPRAALLILGDGRLAFVAGVGALRAWTDTLLAQLRPRFGIYTDGGGSQALLGPGRALVGEGRPAASFLVARGAHGGTVPPLVTTSAAPAPARVSAAPVLAGATALGALWLLWRR